MEKAPVFVKIDDYKDLIDIIALIKEKLGQSKIMFDKINEIKGQEDAELASWAKELEEVEARIDTIDKSMFAPE